MYLKESERTVMPDDDFERLLKSPDIKDAVVHEFEHVFTGQQIYIIALEMEKRAWERQLHSGA